MLNNKLKIRINLIILMTVTGLAGCSKNSSNDISGVNEKLIIPPSLRGGSTVAAKPVAVPHLQTNTRQAQARAVQPRKVQQRPVQRQVQPKKAVFKPDGNYYIIVGTYPDQLEALDTFTRLSSIGLKGATMESRQTKAGQRLHMVRLGPYQKQEDIDQAKDSLTNTGLSQFKIVKN